MKRKQKKNSLITIGLLFIILVGFAGYNFFFKEYNNKGMISNKKLTDLEMFFLSQKEDYDCSYLAYNYNLKLKKDEEILVHAELYYGDEKKQFEYNNELLDYNYLFSTIYSCTESEYGNACLNDKTNGIIILKVDPDVKNSYNVNFYVSNPVSIFNSPMVKINESVTKKNNYRVSKLEPLINSIKYEDLEFDKEIILGKITYGQEKENIQIILKAKLQRSATIIN